MHTIDTERASDNYRNHAQVWELLPWYLNGSLSAGEKQQVAAHAAVCLLCRKELVTQTALRNSVKNYEFDELLVSASFDRLSARLQGQDRRALNLESRPARGLAAFASALKSWLLHQFHARPFVAALAVLALVFVIPAFIAAPFVANNTFRTLSGGLTETAPPADLRLIFADGVTDAERNAILAAAELDIVAGPDARGLYHVEAGNVSADALAATLAHLRADDKVLFAELAVGDAPDARSPGAQ